MILSNMKPKLLRSISKPFLMLFFAMVVLGSVANLVSPESAHAWCNNVNLDFNNVCVSQNYDALPQSIKDKTTRDQYVALAQSCMDGNSSGFDIGIRQGGCADAAKTCLEKAVDVTRVCSGDTMASMVGGVFDGQSFGRDCNDGKLSDDPSDDCVALDQANRAAIDAKLDAATQKAQNACLIDSKASETDKTLAKERCAQVIKDSCPKPAPNGDGTLKNSDDYTNYTQCLDEAYYKKAANKEECMTNRGGIWIDKSTKDPNGPNTLDSGCYKQASDLTNPQACEAGAAATGKKLEWKTTNKAGQPVAYGCVDPDNPNGDQPPVADPNAQCLKGGDGNCVSDGTLAGGQGQCGEAKTNIISCEGTGGTALKEVLRIFVIVLSFGVGIAALGGLAYSAVQYAGASDNQSNVSAARDRIRNIVIGLFLYGFIVAISNFLIPGGIL